MNKADTYRFAIDRGGTFTDIYAEVPGQPEIMVLKLLSEDPRNYPDAPREGIRRIISRVEGREMSVEKLPTDKIEWIRMGTTVATNALLERRGARCALLVTKGFRDILKIGNQDRPHLFDLEIKKPELLYEEVVEVDERLRLLGADEKLPDVKTVRGITGERLAILGKPDLESLEKQLRELLQHLSVSIK